ncbi:MAG: Na/Pi cotransporter family protein [Treponema bryantii]|nr:Na/Pi cotransporter family protein [Treponema bryantii]
MSALEVFKVIFQFAGSLALLLFAMDMLSSGIQKGANDKLQNLFKIISGNRITAVLTGLFVTAVIQSSGATTVMVISFVNAHVLSLTQAIGIIFGANIGTTVTAWIVSLLGFSFSISKLAIPIFGIGFFIFTKKNWKYHDIGEVLMGFGLLFLGLGMLTDVLDLQPESIAFITKFTDSGFWGLLLAVVIGIGVTALIHSSSAFTAIVLTLGYNGALSWEFAAALVFGSNIGSTVDAVLAAIGSSTNAKRAALVHTLFNVSGTLLALCFFRPLLNLVDFIVPGTPESNITNHIAMLHTVFNISATIIFTPFIKQIELLVTKIIKTQPKPLNDYSSYEPKFIAATQIPSASIGIIQTTKEINSMAKLCGKSLNFCIEAIKENNPELISGNYEIVKKLDTYIDSMNETLASFLVKISHLDSAGQNERHQIDTLMQTSSYLKTFKDECSSIMKLIQKASDKKLFFKEKSTEKLLDFALSVEALMSLISINFTTGITSEIKMLAVEMEEGINKTRKKLKKLATHRIEDGGDVNAELIYIDISRHFEVAASNLSNIFKIS